ncbi:MAG: hypothetical protein IIA53_08250 [Chloroflexi bacterium]|nr:hypothetical protein [Chloroflexota bacterium]MCH8911195.1 hypothetical protein [Chloroflexota bacterium]
MNEKYRTVAFPRFAASEKSEFSIFPSIDRATGIEKSAALAPETELGTLPPDAPPSAGCDPHATAATDKITIRETKK